MLRKVVFYIGKVQVKSLHFVNNLC